MIWYDDYFYYLVLVIPAVLLSLFAQIKVKSTFAKYSKVNASCGMTAADVSAEILRRHGLFNTRLSAVAGNLTDNYNPTTDVVSLSESVIDSRSVAAIGVAAHECGHAMQYADGYGPIKFRAALIPITNFGSSLSIPLIFLALITGFSVFFLIGIILFAFSTLFQLVTLPVEFNASRRAIKELEGSGRFTAEELAGVKKVLAAAAMTYVAALLVSLMSLLRLILLSRNRR